MRVLIIANFSDQRCGFQNFAVQTVTALKRAGVGVTQWDGTYPRIYHDREAGRPTFFPDDVGDYDVVHLIWNAMTMNHYNGADWAYLQSLGVVTSWWDGGPSDATCPFESWQQVKWSDYPRDGYEYMWYPVPDWVTDLPDPDPEFTVGASSVRGDGVAEIRSICEANGWAMNLPTPGAWRSVEDEIRRLARSTVNVCWYNTSPIWHNRASAPSMLLASRRPLLVNEDPLVAHLWDAKDLYHGNRSGSPNPDMRGCLQQLHDRRWSQLVQPTITAGMMCWQGAALQFISTWKRARP